MFDNNEKRDMLRIFYQCRRNMNITSEQYLQTYPERRQPHPSYFRKLDKNLNEFGSFEKKRNAYGNKTPRCIRRNICEQINENPSRSTRQVAVSLNLPQTTVWRTLKQKDFKCYRIHVSQTLHPGDSERRLEWCHWLTNSVHNDPNFLQKVIWTDESCFTNCGVFNRNNEHIWATENPREFRELRPQVRFSLNVWAGIYNNRIFGPYIFEETLNGERYLAFLRNNLEEYLDEVPLAERSRMWLQHDGAPPHNSRMVCEFLNIEFPERWIGNQGPVRWPPRSPDLAVLDFFLWGFLKNKVYAQENHTIQELRRNITNAFAAVRRRDLQRSLNSIIKRTRKCIEEGGHQFEHLL